MINGHCDVLTFQLFTYPAPLFSGGGSSSYFKEQEDHKLYY